METSFSTPTPGARPQSCHPDRTKSYSRAKTRFFASARELGGSLASSATEARVLLEKVKDILDYSRARVSLAFAEENALRNLLETVWQER